MAIELLYTHQLFIPIRVEKYQLTGEVRFHAIFLIGELTADACSDC